MIFALQGPEQIHMSYGYEPNEMVFMWSTDESSSSVVHYSPANDSTQIKRQEGESWRFTYGNPDGLQYMHRVRLTDLDPGQEYIYRVESNGQFSQYYTFTAMRTDKDWAPQFIMYGDMGRHCGAPILPRLQIEVKDPENAAIIHVGDIAYNLESDGGKNGDAFMNRIQNLAAFIPYMTAVGNHDMHCNASHYQNRFTMPTDGNPFWYSFDISVIHFISYSTEVYYSKGATEQLAWLKEDLAKANKNRDKQPWVIAYGHRPMYCSNVDHDDCTTPKSIIRAHLETLFYENGVDVIIQGHEHSYERLWPVYNETVTGKNYINPRAPVHIISGAAGCNEILGICLDPILGPKGPEQIHMSYGYAPNEMVFMWSTDESSSSVVHYSPANDSTQLNRQEGESWRFTYGNPKGLQYMHRVNLTDLDPGKKYIYCVESNGQFSQYYTFTAMRTDKDWTPQFIMYGDMGRHCGAPILPRLKIEAKDPENTAIIHVGDIAYDLHSDGGKNGDAFMNRIQDLAAFIPYMTAVGNRDSDYNASHYRNRFSMPTYGNPFWYSFDISMIHFVCYSTEVYFTLSEGASEQLAWLKEDLAKANKNRDKQPWVIAYGHRPMYCSNLDHNDCTTPKSIIRAHLETLFYENGVDVIIQGHEHSYERLWPVYNETVTAKNYINPRAPVHIISGAAGCNEYFGICVNPMLGPKGPWSAFRSWLPGLYGYGLLKAQNATHLHWKQMVALERKQEDAIWIVQKNHGPFNSNGVYI
ncbi:acid phosphatase type 7-like [Corticium candelabrum]|uniref:acid phosphatase type 7-like n=1 Tax=Corticium candelabrum TaxID=121492 RepID=UPI002E26E5B7|nr:acid phosphatase type 7-like [Corticium candelabrum]